MVTELLSWSFNWDRLQSILRHKFIHSGKRLILDNTDIHPIYPAIRIISQL